MSPTVRPPTTHASRPSPTPIRPVLTALAVILAGPTPAFAQTVDYSRAERFLTWHTQPLIAGAGVNPNWMETGDTDRFWYRNNTGSGYEFVLVNPAAASRERLFDHYRLASAMSLANDTSYVPGKLPFSTFRFGDTEGDIEFVTGGRRFLCDIVEYACTVADTLPSRTAFVESPDGRWEAFAHEYNLYVRPAEGGDSIRLTTDGGKYYAYGYNEPRPNQVRQGGGPRAPTLSWSPDFRHIAVSRRDERDMEHMHYISYTPQRPRHFSQSYALPGDTVIPLPTVHILALEETAPAGGDAPGLRATANHQVEIAPTPHQLSFAGSAPDSAWSADGTRLLASLMEPTPCPKCGAAP